MLRFFIDMWEDDKWVFLLLLGMILAMIGLVGYLSYHVAGGLGNNQACKTQCAKAGYATGETAPLMAEDVCICVPSKPGPAGYMRQQATEKK